MSKRGIGFSLRKKIFIGIIILLVILLVGSLTGWFGLSKNVLLGPLTKRPLNTPTLYDGVVVLTPNPGQDLISPRECTVTNNGNSLQCGGDGDGLMAWTEPIGFYLNDIRTLKYIFEKGNPNTYEKQMKDLKGNWVTIERGTWRQGPKVN